MQGPRTKQEALLQLDKELDTLTLAKQPYGKYIYKNHKYTN